MNGMKASQTSTGSAAKAGILVRLRRLISPARLINSLTPAMAGEPSGAVEAAEGWRVRDGVDGPGEELRFALGDAAEFGPGNMAPSHSERLLRSACDLLCSQPITLISATSLSLPPEPGLTTRQLSDMASLMAIEHGLLADVSVNGEHVHVRLTRRIPPRPDRMRADEKHDAAPTLRRVPRKRRN